MLKRLKTALVDSFIGAIAVGWIFAQGIMHFVGIFIDPYTRWLSERQLWKLIPDKPVQPVFPYQMAISEFVYCTFSLLIAYGLLRWLYYPAKEKQEEEQPPEHGA